jgi:hypothetical protein
VLEKDAEDYMQTSDAGYTPLTQKSCRISLLLSVQILLLLSLLQIITMKQILLLLTLVIINNLHAQIGVGTTTPNASAILDISSSSKGLLFPRVALQSSIDKTTIAAPATGLFVYNTNAALNGGTGLFYNAGTAIAPNWKLAGGITFPYYSGVNEVASAFRIDNYSPTATSSAIRAYGGGQGIGLEGIGNFGIGVLASSVSGTALKVDGKMKIAGTGMNPAMGKVLTSDAAGNATWEGAVAFAAVGILGGGSQTYGYATDYKIAFATEKYDLSNNYNNAQGSPHSTLIVPVNGIYHFDVHTQWAQVSSSGGATLTLVKKTGAVVTVISNTNDPFIDGKILSQGISVDVELQANDEVYVLIRQNADDYFSLSVSPENCGFNGRLVIKR